MTRTVIIAALAGFHVASAGVVLAQEGLATSSTIGGHNTVQQAPSGGRTSGAPVHASADGTTNGAPTAEERELERKNNAATQICKGC